MNTVFTTLKKYSKELTMYIFYVMSLFVLLYYVGSFGNTFLSVIGNLFLMIVEIALWLIVPILLTAGKNEIAKITMRLVFPYWVVSTIFAFLSDCTAIAPKAAGLVVAIGVFELLIALAFLVIVVFTAMAFVRKKFCYKKLALLILCGSLVFFLVVFALRIAFNANWGAGWSEYFGVIYKYLALPFGMFFMVLHFEFKLDDMVFVAPKAVPAADAAKEDAAPAEEETIEEIKDPAPAEDTAEGK